MEHDIVNTSPELIGRRIRQARIASGLTQDETVVALAEYCVSLTKAGLSKYERGGSMPKPTALRGLAKVFGVTAGYFLEDREVEVDWLAFRKAARLSKTNQEKVKAVAESYIDAFLSLRDALEPHREAEPMPPVVVKTAAGTETAAMELRNHWKLGLQPIESVTSAIEDGGGIVVEVDGENDLFDGLSGWANETIPLIVVSSSVADDRRRFSLAHELGHLVMKIKARIDEKAEERWAHRFAAAFLVPEEVARRELGEKRRHLDLRELQLLKLKHGLSMQAWIFRAADLGIIDESHKRTLFAEMGSRGWRRVEPVKFDGQEQPTRFRQLVVRALAEGLISRAQAERLCPNVTREAETSAPPVGGMDARSLHRITKADRKRLLEQAAALVSKDYEDGGDLTGFEALSEEDHHDVPSEE